MEIRRPEHLQAWAPPSDSRRGRFSLEDCQIASRPSPTLPVPILPPTSPPFQLRLQTSDSSLQTSPSDPNLIFAPLIRLSFETWQLG
ncbi:hypothetical protein QQP08_011360 [Theobroma cacao]|nr:hypothetical protein QQP08_011360 [Theobroma cacao]